MTVSTVAAVRAIAAWELRTAVRSRWVVATAATFAVVCVAIAFLGLRAQRDLGLAGAGAAIDGLVTVSVLLPPLLGLLLGAAGLSGDRERGLLALLAAQPIRRGTLATSAFVGLTAALWLAIGLAFGLVAVLLVGVAQTADVWLLLAALGATFGLSAAAVAIGIALAAAAATRTQATAAAVSLWFLFAFGLDVALAGLAPALHLGPAGLLAAVLANPLESARILALLGSSPDGSMLGTFGAYTVDRFGTVGAPAVLTGALLGWTVAPLAVAQRLLGRRDV